MWALLSTYWWWALPLVVVVVGIAIRWRRPKPDVAWTTLDRDLQWDTATDESLNKVYDYVVDFSNNTIEWYRIQRRRKRNYGFPLRLGAIFLTVGAGLVPLNSDIPSVGSTVMLAVAGLCISVDLLAGNTSGWVRYMLAQQKIERLRDAFLLEWNALKIAKTDTAGMLERAKTFLLAVGKVVDDETQEWAVEFQSALKEMEKARKAEAESERTGAVEVMVKNPQMVAEWVLEIDGSQRGRTSGKNLAVTDVAVGIRKLKVYGDDTQGKKFSDEKTVKVDGGATITKELELS